MQIKGLCTGLALLLCAGLYAQNAESDFETDGQGTITKYAGWDEAVVIPAQIGGKPVIAIGEKAFAKNNLTSVVIPDTVKTIGNEAFADNKLTSVTIPDGIVIGSKAFFHNNTIRSVTLGKNLVFGGSAFSGTKTSALMIGANFFLDYVCNDRKAGTYTADTQERRTKQDGDFQYIETKYGAYITGYKGSSGNRLQIPDKVAGLAVKALAGFKDISRVRIPNSVTYIAYNAFSGEWSSSGNRLTEIVIPDSVTYIGERAFAFNKLASVTIPDSVTSIGYRAFDSLISITLPANKDYVPAISSSLGEFYNGNGRQAGTFSYRGEARVWRKPDSIEYDFLTDYKGAITGYIGNASDIVIPAAMFGKPVTSIGNGAFSSKKLTSVTIPGSVTSIDDSAFSGNQLTSVTSIGTQAFRYNQLTSVTIGSGVTSIGNSAFSDNRLTSITIPDSVTSIDNYAFYGNQLTSVTLPANKDYVSAISSSLGRAYESNGKKAGTYRDTGSNNWTYTARMGNAVQPQGAETAAVAEAESGTEPQGTETAAVPEAEHGIEPQGAETAAVPDAERGTEPQGTEIAAVVEAESGIVPPGAETAAAADAESDFEPDGSGTITKYTCMNTAVVIPAHIGGKPAAVIGERAFENCSLTRVVLPNTIESIDEAAFANNNLSAITIPDGVTSIGYNAFAGNQLTSVTIPDGASWIGESAFDGNQLTSVTIPASVISIGYRSFAANQLTSVDIPDGVVSISFRAFTGNQLSSVTIPGSVTSIGSEAFAGNQLTSITIGANVALPRNKPAFESAFDRFYRSSGKQAGTYTRENADSEQWTYTAR
jgi:hypothetical protein